MKKIKGAICINHNKYDIYETDKLYHDIYINDDGILCKNSIHLSWCDIIKILKERKIEINDYK